MHFEFLEVITYGRIAIVPFGVGRLEFGPRQEFDEWV
jgi:hypothetical protein